MTTPVVLILVDRLRARCCSRRCSRRPAVGGHGLCTPAPAYWWCTARCGVARSGGDATAAQPAIELPPSVKLTVPVGVEAMTVAVMVTGAARRRMGELKREVVLAALLTTCDGVVLVEPVLFASPA